MKLNRVEIKNFRSIENITITFEPSCRVLVGKNEVGKSNILKALSMLENNKSLDKTDLREGLPSEELVTEGEISFAFTLDLKDRKEIFNSLKSEMLSTNIPILLSNSKGEMTLEQYIDSYFTEGFYQVMIPGKNILLIGQRMTKLVLKQV